MATQQFIVTNAAKDKGETYCEKWNKN